MQEISKNWSSICTQWITNMFFFFCSLFFRRVSGRRSYLNLLPSFPRAAVSSALSKPHTKAVPPSLVKSCYDLLWQIVIMWILQASCKHSAKKTSKKRRRTSIVEGKQEFPEFPPWILTMTSSTRSSIEERPPWCRLEFISRQNCNYGQDVPTLFVCFPDGEQLIHFLVSTIQ